MSWRSLCNKVLTAGMGLFLAGMQAHSAMALGGLIGNGNGSGGTGSAPEIDGPAGLAAIAVLMSVGLIAYNRFRKK